MVYQRIGSAQGQRILLRHGWLCALLVAISLFVILVPNVPVSFPSPYVAVALGTLSGVVALALCYLGLVRFRVFGQPLDLFAGLAFAVLALTNLLVRALGPIVGAGTAVYNASLHLILFTHLIASILFLIGLTRSERIVDAPRRRGLTRRAGLVVALILELGTVALTSSHASLPGTIDQSGRRLIETNSVIVDYLSGQASWVLAANSVDAVLLLLVAAGFLHLAYRTGESHFVVLATALTLLFFSQMHALLVPPISPGYVSTAEGFRLAAYLVLIASLGSRIGGEISERAKSEERLRLSRELHDGLVQQLSLVNLRLSRALEPDRGSERRDEELNAVMRILESAMLEARQVITSLRTGAVTWEELTRAVGMYASELARNHELDVAVDYRGSTPPLPTGLEVELLRILQEAVSNAARHGAATTISVVLEGTGRGLELSIRDNGKGFDPAQAARSPGVGLRSFQERLGQRAGSYAIESTPGAGATIRISVPLGGARQATA